MTGTEIAIATLVLSAGTSAVGLQQQRSAAKDASKASSAIAAENDKIRALQKRQGLLENQRLRRRAGRQRAIEGARRQQDVVNRGIGLGGSTDPAIQGSLVSGLAGQIGNIGQNDQLAEGVFDAQAAIGRFRDSQSQATASRRTGQGLVSLGGAIVNNLGPIVRTVGTALGPTTFNPDIRNV